MVEFNLLPDVKMQHLKAKRVEYLIVTVSFIVGVVAIAVFVLMFLFVDVAQKVRLNDLSNQITTYSGQLKSDKNLSQILTVQNQLQTIPRLESQSPAASRLFGYVTQLVPVSATVSTLTISYGTNTITMNGGADSLATVNTFVDTLKYATFNNTTTKTTGTKAFSSVVLSSFNYNSNSGGSGNTPAAQYTIAFDFNPILFNSSSNVTLVVPNEITTRSILNQPAPALFKANPKTTTSQ